MVAALAEPAALPLAAGERVAPTGQVAMERPLPERLLVLVVQVMRALVAPAGQSMAALAETAQKFLVRLEVAAAVAREPAASLAERAAVTAVVAVAQATAAAQAAPVSALSPTRRCSRNGGGIKTLILRAIHEGG
jgi:hypothetical protein